MNKARILLTIIIGILIYIVWIFAKQPISGKIMRNKDLKIVFLGTKNGILIYNPLSKVISLKLVEKPKFEKNISIYQKAYQIYLENEKEIKNVHYVYLESTDFINKIPQWKHNIKSLIDIIKYFIGIKTNITLFDRITIFPLLINTKPSEVLFIKSQTETKENAGQLQKNITVELIASGADKKTIKKVKSILKENGIDILEEKNADVSQTKVIIKSINDYDKAKKIMDILNIEKEIIIEKRASICDVTLIISKDYKEE
jgi:hypothetical protein